MTDLSSRPAVQSAESDFRDRWPSLQRLLDEVHLNWPEHDAFLLKSMGVRSAELMDTSDKIAHAIIELVSDSLTEHVQDYRWLCGMILEEEIYFARNDRYRYSTFAETYEHVYSDATFMKRYMNGLLLSQVLWYMHAASLHFFSQRLSARVSPGGKVLEVGSGHGLLLFLSLRDLRMSEAVAWDISQVSLDQTRQALAKLGALDRARFAVQDMHQAESSGERFQLIILSHLLEHLEDPVHALTRLKSVLTKDGLIYVNIPLNAPMPDHLILLREPAEVERMLIDGGFRVVEMSMHTTQAARLSRSLRTKQAVTCSVIAEIA